MIATPMADKLTTEHRSWNMSRIRSKNTAPEKLVRSMLHRMGYRFSLHRKNLSGHPDIVMPKHNTVIFVHGCFWHRHKGCRDASLPKTRTEWWLNKLEGNVARDHRNQLALRKAGWRVHAVWECETKNSEKLMQRLGRLLKK
jgi:DNA mismatch endonuclease (patch repair protein)